MDAYEDRAFRTNFAVGLLMLAALLAAAGVIGFFLAKESPLAATWTLDVRFADVAGLKVGAPVTLQGAHIGRIEALLLDGPRPPRFPRTEWVARLAVRDEPWIRSHLTAESTFSVMPESLFGNKFVNATFGEGGAPLASGSVVQGSVAAGIDARTFDKLSVALDNLSGAAAELRGILSAASAATQSPTGTAAVGVDGGPPEARAAPSLRDTLANLDEAIRNTAETTRALKEALSEDNQVKVKQTFDDLSSSAANLSTVTARMKTGMEAFDESMQRLRFWRNWFGGPDGERERSGGAGGRGNRAPRQER
jgi:ABC-type transporter Mla subunit MlaD